MMRQQLRMVLILVTSIVSFVVYWSMWLDWVQDFRAGIYTRHYPEALIETLALAGYTYLGVRFAYSRLNTL